MSTETLTSSNPAVAPSRAAVADLPMTSERGATPRTDSTASHPMNSDVAGAGSEMAAAAPVNEVRLVGRVSALSEPHELPSGDSVLTLRLVVPRAVRRPRQPSVDTIDVACWTPDTQRGALGVGVDAAAEVVGALRRRFFRGAGGAQSRYEVEARSVRPAPASEARDVGGR